MINEYIGMYLFLEKNPEKTSYVRFCEKNKISIPRSDRPTYGKLTTGYVSESLSEEGDALRCYVSKNKGIKYVQKFSHIAKKN